LVELSSHEPGGVRRVIALAAWPIQADGKLRIFAMILSRSVLPDVPTLEQSALRLSGEGKP
jgi:hypothetical protein